MATDIQEVQIIETGNHRFLITCPLPKDAHKVLLQYPHHDGEDYWDRIVDRGHEGFEIHVNTHTPGGDARGLPGLLDILQHLWRSLYEQRLVPVSEMPDIQFGDVGSETTIITG